MVMIMIIINNVFVLCKPLSLIIFTMNILVKFIDIVNDSFVYATVIQ